MASRLVSWIKNGLFVVVLAVNILVIASVLYKIFIPQPDMGWDALANFIGFFFVTLIISLLVAWKVSTKIAETSKKRILIFGTILIIGYIIAGFLYKG